MTSVGAMVLAAIMSIMAGEGGEAGEVEERPVEPSEDDRGLAKEAFDNGLAAVAAGEFQVAVDSFEQAYSLRPHPVTLFNLALALELAERLPEAWELFEAVIDLVESDAERREVRRHMRAIASQIAILEVHATARYRICLDGSPMPRDENDELRLALEPTKHTLLLDDHELHVDLEPGDQRVLLLEDTDLLIVGRRRNPVMPGMIGMAIGTGGLALGLGVGAAAVDDPQVRTGLAAGAASSAGLAVVASVVALLLETRGAERAAEREQINTPGCPGPLDLEQRIDLRLAPTIRRPAEFTQLELRMPIPIEASPSSSRDTWLAGIAPRRNQTAPHIAAPD